MQVDARTHFYPYHRNEKYPRHLMVDFRKAKPSTLKKYAESYELSLRPDVNGHELAVAVARHFESHLDVDEDEALSRFLNSARKAPPPTAMETLAAKRTSRRVEPTRNIADDMMPTDEAVAVAEGRTLEEDAGVRTRGIRQSATAGSRTAAADREGEDRYAAAARRVAAAKRPAASAAPSNGAEGGENAAEGDAVAEGGDGEDGEYCFCHGGSFGEMIGCDNDDCQYEWFHVGCVGLLNSKRPSGNWFCPECRKTLEPRVAAQMLGFNAHAEMLASATAAAAVPVAAGNVSGGEDNDAGDDDADSRGGARAGAKRPIAAITGGQRKPVAAGAAVKKPALAAGNRVVSASTTRLGLPAGPAVRGPATANPLRL